MVWPTWVSDRIVEFVVLENLASISHFLFAFALTVIGCGARVFWAYAFYQFYTTAAKTLSFPDHTLRDWTWDFVGDTVEFLIGIGLATALGVNSKITPPPPVRRACSKRGILVGLGLLTLVWLVFYLRSLSAGALEPK